MRAGNVSLEIRNVLSFTLSEIRFILSVQDGQLDRSEEDAKEDYHI